MNAVILSDASDFRTFGSVGVSTVAAEIDDVFVKSRRPLEAVDRKIRSLSSEAGTPTDRAINSATQFLRILFGRAVKLGAWNSPHITLSENNEIVFEWWQGNKKITLYFGDGEPEYIKVWGTDIDDEMDSGPLTDGWNLTSLWLWLYS